MMDKYYYFQSYYYSLKGLKPATRYAVREAIDEYMFEDKEPNFNDAVSKSIWMLLFPTLHKSKTNYENAKSKRQANQEQNASEMKANAERNESESQKSLQIRPSISMDKGERNKEKGDNITPVIPQRGVKFVPPTKEDVEAYIKEKGYTFDAEGFLAFYEANGWVQGNSRKPIKSWKACCVTWSKSPYNKTTNKSLHDKAFGVGEQVEVRF